MDGPLFDIQIFKKDWVHIFITFHLAWNLKLPHMTALHQNILHIYNGRFYAVNELNLKRP